MVNLGLLQESCHLYKLENQLSLLELIREKLYLVYRKQTVDVHNIVGENEELVLGVYSVKFGEVWICIGPQILDIVVDNFRGFLTELPLLDVENLAKKGLLLLLDFADKHVLI